MDVVFYKVLEMSLYGSIAILAVLLFRLVFQKCPKRILILFWIIVALRLVIPFNFNSPTSALNFGKLFAPKSVTEESAVYDPESRLRELTVEDNSSRVVNEPAPAIADPDAGIPDNAPLSEDNAPKVTFKTVIPYIWLSITVGLLIFSAVRYAIFYSKARWSSRSFDGRYYMANNIDSPFVVGIFSPKIFFPFNMDDDEREYVLNHEWTHIKNKDGLTKFLSYIVLCIHWFNPLVWLAFFMLCADIEMRVDEETTSNFNLKMVKEYCKSLVRHAADDNKGAFMQSTAFSGLSFGGMETKIRIKNLLNNKIDSRGIQITSIAVTMVFALLVSAASVDHQPAVKAKPSEPSETLNSESVLATDSTSDTTPEAAEGVYADYREAYLNLAEKNGERNQNIKYALLFIDGDDIPEVIVDEFYVSGSVAKHATLYAFRDGKLVPVYNDPNIDDHGSNSYFYLPYQDSIIHSYTEDSGLIRCERYTMNGMINGEAPVVTGHIENGTYFVEGRAVEYDEFSKSFNFREADGILGNLVSQEFIIKLKGGSAVSTETTAETTEATPTPTPTAEPTKAVETTVPAEDKLLSISKIKDFTVIPFVNESNNSTFAVSGEFGSIVCRILPEKVVRFTIKDKSFEYAIPSTSTGGIYLLKDYGKANIFIQFYVEGGNQICAYNVFDNGVFFKGAVNNATFERAVDNPRTFWIIENYGEGALVDIRRHYSMSKTTGMPAPDTYLMYTCFNVKMPLKSKVNLCGYLMINGTIYKNNLIYIYVGEKVTPVQTDEKDVIIIQKEDGTVLQVNFKDQKDRFYDSNNYRWVYNAIVDWFEPA